MGDGSADDNSALKSSSQSRNTQVLEEVDTL